MKPYAAFLRGVMPTNAKMAELRAAFEAAGFRDVKTVLGSGNVVFSSASARPQVLARQAEAAMQKRLGRTFLTIVRPVDSLRALLDSDPFRSFRLAPDSRRVVTFLRGTPRTRLKLPIEVEGARILSMKGAEVFSVYVPTPRGPVFMSLIEKSFGTELTTRTWETVAKVAR